MGSRTDNPPSTVITYWTDVLMPTGALKLDGTDTITDTVLIACRVTSQHVGLTSTLPFDVRY